MQYKYCEVDMGRDFIAGNRDQLLLLRSTYALAFRVSNVVWFIVLFIAGYQWGRHTGANPWRTGLLLFAVGAIMVLIAIPLGGIITYGTTFLLHPCSKTEGKMSLRIPVLP